MKKSTSKSVADILSMLLMVAAIITGFILHSEVWHLHIYDNTLLWATHEAVGLILLVLVIIHCLQHSFWFKNYSKIQPPRKIVTTILLLVGVMVAVSGMVLMCGSHSEFVSHSHYVSGILFTVLAIGHVAKRWKIFKSLL